MKLAIELNDEDIKRAINHQIGAAVATLAGEVLKERIDEVINLKLGRVTDLVIDEALVKEVRVLVLEKMGSGYQLQEKVKGALATVARELILKNG